MQELNMMEVEHIFGSAMSENQCIGAFSLVGGALFGGAAAFSGPIGWAAYGAASGWGMAFGAGVGMLACKNLIDQTK